MIRTARTLLLLLVLLVGMVGSQPLADVEVQLEGDHVANISRMIQRYHISRDPFDDARSAVMLDRYIAQFDPARLYFLQSDIQEFSVYRDKLDDMVPRGNIEPAFLIDKRFLQRMHEREAEIEKFLAGKMEVSEDVPAVLDRRKALYPKDAAEAATLWHRKLKQELLEHMATGASEADSRDFLRRRYHSGHMRMDQITHNEVISMFLNALASTYDPHSSYLLPDELENLNITLSLSLEGIGATLRWEDGYTIISSIVPGGAAAREGTLKPEDKIIAVGQGKDGALEDVRNQRLTDVVKLIRGRRGTLVRLAYLRKSDGVREKRSEIVITRDKIVLTDREAKGTIMERKRPEREQPYRIGVIDLPSFYVDFSRRHTNPDTYKSSFRDVEHILQNFVVQGVDGVVLDIRDNGGGGLDEAVQLSGLFLERGVTVVRVRDNNGEINNHDNPAAPVYRGPLVVLVNRYSASASEILAGALKDYGRAIIVGDKTTFGKGTVQNIISLPTGLGGVKTTVAKFYRPGSSSTQNRGVESDIVLPSLNNYLEIGESSLENSLPWDSLGRTILKPWSDLAPYLPALAERSRQRQQASTYFRQVNQDIALYLERKKNRGEITIRQLLAEQDQDAKEAKQGKPPEHPGDKPRAEPGKPQAPDAVLNESMEVLIDYLRMSTGANNIAIGKTG